MAKRLDWPRLDMAAIVSLTGAIGLIASVELRHVGVHSMWMRYPLAVAVAYAGFLLSLWLWLLLRRLGSWGGSDDSDSQDSPPDATPHQERNVPGKPAGGGGRFGGGGASGSFGESSDISSRVAEDESLLDDEPESAVGLLFFGAIAAVCALAAAWLVWIASEFLAELVLDAPLATGLYRRLRLVSGDHHWFQTALRRSWWLFVGVALLLALAGAVMQIYAPEAGSIGEVIRRQ